MRKLLLATGFVLALAIPAQAQPLVTVSCSSVFVDFRTSIQPDSATVQIDSNAGTEIHAVTLVQGGTDTVTFPLDGQSGESVTVTVTLVYKGQPNVVSSTTVLADCPVPSPSPTVSPESSPSPIATADAPAVTPGASSSPEPTEESVVGEVVTRSEDVSELPAELAYTGFSQILGLLILAVSVIGLGLYSCNKGRKFEREAEEMLRREREKSNVETKQEREHLWEYLGDEVEPTGPPHTHPRSEG